MNRKNVIYIGIRDNDARNPWYLTISETARREVQLPYHRKLRVRTSPNSSPIILPVEHHFEHTPKDGTLVPIRVQKNKQGIVLGPIIGILTVRRPGTSGFRGNRANFRDILLMGKRLGLTVVVFTPEGIGSQDSVDCHIYTDGENPMWKRVRLPMPSVVYNRVPDREAEVEPGVKRAKKWLEQCGIPIFNDRFFDKQSIFDWLSTSQETQGYLPHTAPLHDPKQIQHWVRRYGYLYVKPVDGKAGDGILQIRTEGSGFRVTYQKNGRRTRALFATPQETARAVWRKTEGRSYVIQQGVHLATFNGRQFDLRLLVQKNRYGRWRVTGMGARVADSDGITTHVPNGGEIERDLTALRAAFGEERGFAIWRQARVMALEVAEAIERENRVVGNNHLGEMSMDIGVAAEGKLWFFEANAKPMKFDEPLIRAKSLFRLLHYCDYLARCQ